MPAGADPKPIRLASPITFCVTKVEISSSPLRPLLITQTMSNARSDSITVITRITMFTGRITGQMTWKNVRTSLAPSTAAASRSAGSTAFRPARYSSMMYPVCRQLAATSTAHRLMSGSPNQSVCPPNTAFSRPWSRE